MSKLPLKFDPRLDPLPPYFEPKSRVRELPVWLLAISAGLAVMNVSIVPSMERSGPDEMGALWGLFCIGSFGGQAGILAIAAVLGPASTLRRHLYVFPSLLAFALAWFLGFLISQSIYGRNYPEAQDVAALLFVVPLLFCVCEAPLWVFRTFLRWRIEVPAETKARPPQLTIAGILGATAAVALSLGAIRLGHKLTGRMDEADWWMGVAIAAAWCGGTSLLVLPVVTALVFRTQSLVIGLLVSAAWIGLILFSYLLVMSSLAGSFPSRELHLLFSLYAGFCSTLLGPFALCRLYGYRLLGVGAVEPSFSSARNK